MVMGVLVVVDIAVHPNCAFPTVAFLVIPKAVNCFSPVALLAKSTKYLADQGVLLDPLLIPAMPPCTYIPAYHEVVVAVVVILGLS